MAPGYEIALWLEALGLAGLALGAWRLRVEEAGRVRALKTVLRTGPADQHRPRVRPRTDRTRMVPHRPALGAPAAPSAAARALARAFPRAMREA